MILENHRPEYRMFGAQGGISSYFLARLGAVKIYAQNCLQAPAE